MTEKDLLDELTCFASPLADAACDEQHLITFFEAFGYELHDDDVFVILAGFESIVEAINAILQNADATSENYNTNDLIQFVAALRSLSDDAKVKDYFSTRFFDEVFDYLLFRYLSDKVPVAYAVLVALGVIETEDINSTATNGRDVDYTQISFNWQRISEFVSNNATWAKEVYGWAGNPARDEKSLDYDKLVTTFTLLMESTGLSLVAITVASKSDLAGVLQNADGATYVAATIPIYQDDLSQIDTTGNAVFAKECGLKLLPYGDLDQPEKLGFALAPYSQGEFSGEQEISDNLKLNISVSSKITGGEYITITPDGIANSTGGSIAGEFEFKFMYSKSQGEVISLLKVLDQSGIAASKIDFAVGGNVSGDIFVEGTWENLQAVLDVSGDRFLGNFVTEPATIEVGKIIVGWSYKNGVSFEAGYDLGIVIPLNVAIGPITITEIGFGFDLSGTPKFSFDVSGELTLGPLVLSIGGFGFYTSLVSAENGLLGKYDLSSDLSPPSSIGLAIDSQGFTGGGFLYLDADKGEYSGGLELSFNNMLTISALGFITTKMTDGSVGYSLLLIISTEFTPIQLGFGFTLNGVGGLFGYNRSVDLEELRDGVKTGAYDEILFPSDIVANANQIVSDIVSIFPTEDGQFLFGPMAKIGWGTPTLLTVELGLIIEIPDPVQLAILGVLKAILPDEDNDLLRIQVNFLGTIDFEAGSISFDATIFDSSLITFTLSGDMAFRLSWGDDPNFLITVGGFNPAYNPPPLSLPDLDRLTVKLVSGNNPRITIETYFAVTSNTVQFGAKADVYAEAWKVYVSGYMSFDALFQFSPFWFTISMSAMVDVGMGNSTLMSVRLDVDLEGPSPWKASGEASFKVLCVKVEVDFKKTFGESKDTTLPDVPVLPLLVAALENTSNWLAELPDRSRLSVTLNEISVSSGEIVAHPAGTLKVSQKVVPLEMTIETFGAQKPSDATRFEIDEVTSGMTTLSISDVEEYFAPAQFESLSDSEKLSRNSFEKMTSGVTINASSDLQSSKYLVRDVEYEQIIIDSTFTTRLVVLLAQSMKSFPYLLAGSSSAQATYSYAKTAPSSLAPDRLSISQEGFSVVGVEDLTLTDEQSTLGSEAAASAYMNELIKKNPSLASEIQVVPNYEVAAA